MLPKCHSWRPSKLLEESRKIVEQGAEEESSLVLLKMILQIVMAMDERMTKIENGMTKITEIKDAITSVSSSRFGKRCTGGKNQL